MIRRDINYAVVDSDDEVIVIQHEKYGNIRAIFNNRNDAIKLAAKFSKQGFKVITVGLMKRVK